VVWQSSQQAQAAPRYVTRRCSAAVKLTVSANGTLQPTRSVTIGSELSGTVRRVLVDVNDRVKKGQVLVELDTAKLRPGAALACLGGRGPGQAGAGPATKGGAPAWRGWKRWRACPAARCPRPPSWTPAAPPASAQADEAAARASVQDARAALATDETNLTKASIRSPIDGVVLTRVVEPGNAVAASLQAVTLFTWPKTWAGCAWR
jgi:HlyD family secretion protein